MHAAYNVYKYWTQQPEQNMFLYYLEGWGELRPLSYSHCPRFKTRRLSDEARKSVPQSDTPKKTSTTHLVDTNQISASIWR